MTASIAAWLDGHPGWDVAAHPLDAMLLQLKLALVGRRDLEPRVLPNRWLPEGTAYAFNRAALEDAFSPERIAEGLQRDLDEWLRNQESAHRWALEQSVIDAAARHRLGWGDITGP